MSGRKKPAPLKEIGKSRSLTTADRIFPMKQAKVHPQPHVMSGEARGREVFPLFLSMVFVFLVGLSLVILLHVTQKQSNEQQVIEAFASRAAIGLATLDLTIHGQLEHPQLLSRVFTQAWASNSTDIIAQDQWLSMVDPLTETSAVEGLIWTPRVLDANRVAFELGAQDDFAGYEIWNLTSVGPSTASASDDYYPVRLVAPFGSVSAAGFNMLSEDARRTALEKARDTGEPAASEPIYLVLDEIPAAGMLYFVPVYDPTMPTSSQSQRRAAILGCTAVVFRIGGFAEAVEEWSEGEHIEIFDGETSIFANSAHNDGAEDDEHELVYSEEHILEVGGRDWTIVFSLDDASRANSYTTLIFGLAALAALMFGLTLSVVRARNIDTLVAQRTITLTEFNNQLAEEVAVRKKVEEELQEQHVLAEQLLEGVFPARIVPRLLEGENPIADRVDECTVVFCEITGFTSLTQHLQPGAVVQLLGDIFRRAHDLAVECGVEPVKSFGSRYLVVAGLTESQPSDHAWRALLFTSRMNGLVKEYTGLGLRVGMNSGPIVSGVLGTTKFAYGVWGRTVTVASVLEASGVEGKVLAGRDTLQCLAHCGHGPDVQVTPCGESSVDGIGDVHTAYIELRQGSYEA